jgi:hypothetical protein
MRLLLHRPIVDDYRSMEFRNMAERRIRELKESGYPKKDLSISSLLNDE